MLWFADPGESGGNGESRNGCSTPPPAPYHALAGAPPVGHYFPAYAVMLAQNRVDAVTGPPRSTTQKMVDKMRKRHRKRKRVVHRKA